MTLNLQGWQEGFIILDDKPVHEHKSPMTLAVVSGIFNVSETATEEAAELQTLTEQMLRWRGLERQVSGF